MNSKAYWILAAALLVAVAANSIYQGEEFDEEEFDEEEFDDEKQIGEHNERKGKIREYGLNIVRFANTECSTSNTMNGTCLARRECNNLNGTITGTCASRRGRCCIVSQPDGDGNCLTDSITVTGGNTVVPTLCGDLTGQTIFVDFNGNTAITVTVTATLATTFSRRWNVKLTQLGCDCPGVAPNGCLQYYTGITGTIPSFNYGTAANTALSASLVTGTRQIVNLNYGICIRMEAGYCAIQYAQA
ncbi:Uncharacterized protein OBRU01_17471, partial [Operophtera brumata]